MHPLIAEVSEKAVLFGIQNKLYLGDGFGILLVMLQPSSQAWVFILKGIIVC